HPSRLRARAGTLIPALPGVGTECRRAEPSAPMPISRRPSCRGGRTRLWRSKEARSGPLPNTEKLAIAGLPAVHAAAVIDSRRGPLRSEEHTSELQSRSDLVCRLLLENKKKPPA